MTNPLIAPDCKNRISASACNIRRSLYKKGISRIFTLFVILVMLAQVLFIGPGRKAEAKAKPPVVDTSSPAEPFIIHTPPTFAGSVISGVSSLLGFIAPTKTKREDPKTKESAIEPPSPATAKPAPFLPSGSAYDLAALRLDPKNATGGTDLYSRNFGWATSLVGLPGRAGLDAGFGISYNSLVWLKDPNNNEIIFDPDTGNAGPGFRLGLPVIEGIYFDSVNSRYAFVMVNPDGSRTEFRRVGATDNYEAGDSTYRELKVTSGNFDMKGGITQITVTSTDGTMMHYVWKSAASRFMCVEIKDRNGNYISVGYSGVYPTTVTDTLGRIITINYDGGGFPTSITQDWKAANGEGTTTTHTWAAFEYTNVTVAASFSGGLTRIGPANSTTVKALEKITYPDGSFTKFEYNGYVQIKKISRVAANSTSHILNYVSTNLDSVSGTQGDCPRLTTTRTWVENFNLSGGTPQEVVVTNSLTTGVTFSLPGITSPSSTTRIDVALTGHPDGLYSRTYVGDSGYTEGLTIATEDCIGTNCATKLRWTWGNWTQDNTGVSYITNPRVAESRVGDSTNVKKTSVTYSSSYGLPTRIRQYDSNLTTILKTQTFSYDLSSTYTTRNIIGLVTETAHYQGSSQSGTLLSRVTYAYDEGNMTGTDPVQNISPTQHDNTNYSYSFVTGRGLMTSIKRWDATDPYDSNDAVISSMKYNTAGAVVSKTTPWDGTNTRTVKIDYADNFNTNGNPTTYAYPTKVYDPAGNYSQAKYRYDIGANVWAKSPAPAGNTTGKETTREFDSVGRPLKETLVNNGAYTRYEYPTNGIQSKVFSTIVDTDSDGADTDDEVLSESWMDGAGRVRMARAEHPESEGGYAGYMIEYDILGRAFRQTVPTEVNSSWNPAGDDYRGMTGSNYNWLWNTIEFDWKGRTTRTIPSDSTGSDGKDSLISYVGCGCAGGQVTTFQGPSVPRDDQPNTNARRVQKSYDDVLGRTYKSETYQWDGTTAYTTTINTFNGRDQVTLSRQYAGTSSSTTYQDTIATFDGHGRLKTSHKPVQDANKTTTYTYNPDDKPFTIIDATGARQTLTYDNRGRLVQRDFDMTVAQDIDYLTPVIYGLENGGPSDRYHIVIKGNNFGSNPQVKVNTWTSSFTYQGSQLQRSESNGDQFIAIDLQSSTEQYQLTNTLGIGISVKNTPGNKVSGEPALRVYLANPNPPYPSLEITLPYNHTSNAVIPERVIPAASVSYEYDNLGNVTKMTDGMGEQIYEYDSLSRLVWEKRNFSDSLPSQTIPANGFKIQYQYGLSGQLQNITDPHGEQVNYSQDKTGRLKTVSGIKAQTQATVNYITETDYRAFGASKKTVVGGITAVETTFNNRLLPNKTILRDQSNVTSEFNYQYNADGKLRFSDEAGYFPGKESGTLDQFDRSFDYDFLGRMTLAKTGAEARGQTETDFTKRPYRETFSWDAFGHLTDTDKEHWVETYTQDATSFINEREPVVTIPPSPYVPHWGQVSTPVYDAEGRRLGTHTDSTSDYGTSQMDGWSATYDEGGNRVRSNAYRYGYDGSGKILKEYYEDIPRLIVGSGFIQKTTTTKYFIYSSVLGEVINEIGVNTHDAWYSQHSNYHPDYVHTEWSGLAATNMYAGGKRIARVAGTSTQLNLEDANGHFYQEIDIGSTYPIKNSIELDPFRAGVGEANPYPPEGGGPPDDGCGGTVWEDGEWGNEPPCTDEGGDPMSDEDAEIGSVPENTCYINGFEGDCREVANHPDMYEEDNGAFSIVMDKDGNRSFTLNTNNSPSALTSSGKWVPRYDKNSIKIDGMTTDYPSTLLGYDFVANDRSASAIGRGFGDYARIIYLGDEERTAKKIRGIIDYAAGSEACRKAFEAAGAVGINDQLANLTIVTEKIFSEPLYDGGKLNWTQNSDVGKDMRAALRQHKTTNDLSWPGMYGDTGQRFIGITNRAIKEEDDYLSVTVIHSLLHSGGMPGQDNSTWFDRNISGNVPHDLKNLGEKYKAVLKACTREGGSRALYGQ
jgi:YD repeat-containing protein